MPRHRWRKEDGGLRSLIHPTGYSASRKTGRRARRRRRWASSAEYREKARRTSTQPARGPSTSRAARCPIWRLFGYCSKARSPTAYASKWSNQHANRPLRCHPIAICGWHNSCLTSCKRDRIGLKERRYNLQRFLLARIVLFFRPRWYARGEEHGAWVCYEGSTFP
jgi:hypothetical protein